MAVWNLERKRHTVGTNFHRAGWPWVYQQLRAHTGDDGIHLCDFVEERFCYQYLTDFKPPAIAPAGCYPHIMVPWVGIFHHPWNLPPWCNPREHPGSITSGEDFAMSARTLRLAVALTEYLADWLRDILPVPVAVVRYPTEIPARVWTVHAFRSNPYPRLVSLGHWCRNTRLLYQVPPITGWGKVRILPDFYHVQEWDQLVSLCYADGRLPSRSTQETYVEAVGFQPAEILDDLLSNNVVVMEVFDASASTVLVECIARGTPIIVNRHQALVEYLGADYPLYFREPDEIPGLLSRVVEAHEYLLGMDRSWLSGDRFCDDLEAAIRKATP